MREIILLDNSYTKSQKVIVGMDPGGTTGAAVLSLDGLLLLGVHLSTEDDILEFFKLISSATVIAVVVEDFQLLPHKAKAMIGSKMKTIQIIGQIKLLCKMNGFSTFTQSPTIKSIAQKWSKRVPKGKHDDNHYLDAYNHAFYWMVKRGYVEPRSNVSR